ncbi:hypothetical protein [Candidatus Enterovibrio altilux]|uniref:Uncharacterized protein n=1 Tax=Candidatus Enterovibrio altilux TaxID=1927128 RepID=A0A291B885_9GAMM|nr:hypothetical protein [Candidatus Enterovibrio luxaltus]ATF09224.1 hypothetical protein BTN50_0708 [Candidatus Enterovibrio luxaltus]
MLVDINAYEIIAAELSISDVITVKFYLTSSHRPAEKSIQSQPVVLTTPNNVTKPFILNEQFHSCHQEK